MQKNLKQIVDALMAMWPEMEYPWIYDRDLFFIPTEDMMRRALESSMVPRMQVVDEFNDCDDFALHFLSEFRMKQYRAFESGKLPPAMRFPPAVGIVFGDRFRGIEDLHQLNVAVCEEGIFLVDPYPGISRVWKADPKNDNVIKLAYM